MKKQLPFLFLVLMPIKALSSIVTINYDYKTIEAMSEAYSLERLEEALYLNAIDSIYRSYSSSEIATAGIYLSKYLDYKALSSSGILEDKEKNYYYKRIYTLVKEKIMPKIFSLSVLMLSSPKSAIYWGSYLSRTCNQVEQLCKQFEALVTNYTLSFKDIVFLKVIDEFKEAFSLNKANLLIQNMIENFDALGDEKEEDFLSSSVDELYNLGIGIANLGSQDDFSSSSSYNLLLDFINKNLTKMLNTQDEVLSLFTSFSQEKQKEMLSSLGINEAKDLFQVSPYDISSWTTNYLLDEEKNSFYTQTWSIYPVSQEKEIAYLYEPNTSIDNVSSSLEWIRLSSLTNLSEDEKEMILSNSEEYSSLSRSFVEDLNLLEDGYSYSFYSEEVAITLSNDLTAYAYKIWIEKTPIISSSVYEEIYDSYSMDLNVFLSLLEVKLYEYNLNEEAVVYTLRGGRKNYYEFIEDETLEKLETVTFLLSCHDKQSLSTGSTQYKCKDETSSLSSLTKQCAMLSLSEDEALDLSGLYEKEEEMEAKISALEAQIKEVEDEIKELENKINSNSSSINRTSFLATLNEKRDLLSSLDEEKDELLSEYNDMNEAIKEAQVEEEETNDCYRIPAIMEKLEKTYNLSWESEGYWDNYTFKREASIKGILGTARFSATLKMIRKPKTFLGILIHRAIIKISWELTLDFENTSTLEVLTLDESLTSIEKRDLISSKILEYSSSYLDCEVSTQYSSSKDIEKQNISNNRHLLWMEERILEAQDIEKELSNIYKELLQIEKYLFYKVNVRDAYLSYSSHMYNDKEKRKTLNTSSFKSWLNNLNKTLK